MDHANKDTTDRLRRQSIECALVATQLKEQAMTQVIKDDEPAKFVEDFDQRMQLLRESRKFFELSMELIVTAEYAD
jgi:hypothetical protein